MAIFHSYVDMTRPGIWTPDLSISVAETPKQLRQIARSTKSSTVPALDPWAFRTHLRDAKRVLTRKKGALATWGFYNMGDSHMGIMSEIWMRYEWDMNGILVFDVFCPSRKSNRLPTGKNHPLYPGLLRFVGLSNPKFVASALTRLSYPFTFEYPKSSKSVMERSN